MIDELGRKLTSTIRMLELARQMNIKVNPVNPITDLLQCKDIVNRLKEKE